jgi:hypothetical protein
MSISSQLNFFPKTFVKETKYPIVAILLFIIVITLNSIQYIKKNNTYLQQLFYIVPNKNKKIAEYSLGNSLLFFYDLIGINGFLDNTPAFSLYFLFTYFCFGLIELNIGHAAAIYFFIILLMFQYFITIFTPPVCEGNIYTLIGMPNSPYCCGSFVLMASLGFILFLLQKNIKNIKVRALVLLIIILIWVGCILYDRYVTFEDSKYTSQKICHSFLHHAINFMLGLFSSYVIGNY